MCWGPRHGGGPISGIRAESFQNWIREIKFRVEGQPGASAARLLGKLIHALPLAVKTDALIYMEQTERDPAGRSIVATMDILDARLGRANSERASSWLAAFAEFKRESHGNYKDFWARFTRCVAKLDALSMQMNEKVVFNRATRALRLPDGQLPVALSALETRPCRFSGSALREIAIRMCETHRPGGDSAEVYAPDIPGNSESLNTFRAHDNSRNDDDWDFQAYDWGSNHDNELKEVLLEGGSIMRMKPKKPVKPRNTHGVRGASRRGAVKKSSHIPNRKGKGAGRRYSCVVASLPIVGAIAQIHPEGNWIRESRQKEKGDIHTGGIYT